MLLYSRSENEFSIIGIPICAWGLGTACLVLMVMPVILFLFASVKESTSKAIEIVLDWNWIWVGLGSALFAGGAFFMFTISSAIVTNIDREQKIVKRLKYNLRRRVHENIPFSDLKGGVQVRSEWLDSDGTIYIPYLETVSGRKLKLCDEPMLWKRRGYLIAKKANEFIGASSILDSEDETITLGLNS